MARMFGAPEETRTPKIWFLRPTRIPIPSPGQINILMNKKQLTDYIIEQLQSSGKQHKTSGQKLAYDLGFIISLLAELSEHDVARTAYIKKKMTRLKQSGAPNKN